MKTWGVLDGPTGTYELKTPLIRIGRRKKKVDIVVSQPYISSLHCILELRGVDGNSQAWITNASRNPMFINDKPLLLDNTAQLPKSAMIQFAKVNSTTNPTDIEPVYFHFNLRTINNKLAGGATADKKRTFEGDNGQENIKKVCMTTSNLQQEDLVDAAQAMQRSNQELRQRLNEAGKREIELKNKLNAVLMEQIKHEEQIDKIQQQSATLRKSLTEERANSSEKDSSITVLKKKNINLQNEIEQYQFKLQTQSQTQATITQRLHDTEMDKKQLEEIVGSLKDYIKNMSTQTLHQSQQIRKLEIETKILQDRIDSHGLQSNFIDEDNRNVLEENVVLKAKFFAAHESFRALFTKMEQLGSKLSLDNISLENIPTNTASNTNGSAETETSFTSYDEDDAETQPIFPVTTSTLVKEGSDKCTVVKSTLTTINPTDAATASTTSTTATVTTTTSPQSTSPTKGLKPVVMLIEAAASANVNTNPRSKTKRYTLNNDTDDNNTVDNGTIDKTKSNDEVGSPTQHLVDDVSSSAKLNMDDSSVHSNDTKVTNDTNDDMETGSAHSSQQDDVTADNDVEESDHNVNATSSDMEDGDGENGNVGDDSKELEAMNSECIQANFAKSLVSLAGITESTISLSTTESTISSIQAVSSDTPVHITAATTNIATTATLSATIEQEEIVIKQEVVRDDKDATNVTTSPEKGHNSLSIVNNMTTDTMASSSSNGKTIETSHSEPLNNTPKKRWLHLGEINNHCSQNEYNDGSESCLFEETQLSQDLSAE